MSDPVQTIVDLVGCPADVAQKTYQELQDVLLAVDVLLSKPACAGNQ